MKRIIVLGRAGVGKTRFSRRLAARLGCPAIILDEIWRPEWAGGDLAEFRALVAAAHAGEAWVSDGNFALATFDLRAPRADLAIWLERPTWLALWRATTRVFRPGEAHRPADLPKSLAFILNFDRVNRPRIEAALNRHGSQARQTTLRSDAEAEAFLAQV